MKPPPYAALLHALVDPGSLAGLPPTAWADRIALARSANLLGALAVACARAEVAVDPRAARHLQGARQLGERQRESVRWEAQCIDEALAPLGQPVVLLKGAAYVLGDHAFADGRLFGDIDVLVPRAVLGDVELKLMLRGWVSAKADAYDQRYYRQWMHELPPMSHVRRGSVIDVHHTILPLTARHAPDPALIIDRARALPGLRVLRVPCDEDLVLHSLTHLMHEGELHHGLRDLYDIDSMLRRFGSEPGFWDRLRERAQALDLAEPVALGLALACEHFGTPFPPTLVPALLQGRHPPAWLGPVYRRALAPPGTAGGGLDSLATLAVYVRAHALRMPPALLLRHLAVKGWRAVALRRGQAPAEPAQP